MKYYQYDEESSPEVAYNSNVSSKISNLSLSKIAFAGLISIILILALTINYPQKTLNISHSYSDLASVYGEKVLKTTLNNVGNMLIKFNHLAYTYYIYYSPQMEILLSWIVIMLIAKNFLYVDSREELHSSMNATRCKLGTA